MGTDPNTGVSVTLLKPLTVTGHVSENVSGANADDAVIIATNDDDATQTRTGTINNSTHDYTVTGLTNGNWTVTATKDGVGQGDSPSIAVNGTTVSPITGRDITLTPRTITFTFTVTSTPKGGATVTMGSATSTSSDATTGVATLQIAENLIPAGRNWSATQTGKRTTKGTVAAGSTAANVSMLDPISGTVQVGTT